MEAREIRELTNEEIDAEIERAREELFNLRFRSSYEELENPSLLKDLRREIARLKTIRRERELRSVGDADA
jgi:large subunit ribosomal protein L29